MTGFEFGLYRKKGLGRAVSHGGIENSPGPGKNSAEREIQKTQAEKEKIIAEIEEKKRLDAERQRRLELERRRPRRNGKESWLRKLARFPGGSKNQIYKSGEKEGLLLPPPPPLLSPLSPKVTESGVFLVMKEAAIHEEPIEKSKVISRGDKYDLFERNPIQKG